jgi:hypothetical protein
MADIGEAEPSSSSTSIDFTEAGVEAISALLRNLSGPAPEAYGRALVLPPGGFNDPQPPC